MNSRQVIQVAEPECSLVTSVGRVDLPGAVVLFVLVVEPVVRRRVQPVELPDAGELSAEGTARRVPVRLEEQHVRFIGDDRQQQRRHRYAAARRADHRGGRAVQQGAR